MSHGSAPQTLGFKGPKIGRDLQNTYLSKESKKPHSNMITEPPDYTERETPKLCRDEWNDSKKNTLSLGRLEIMTDFAMQTTEGRNDSMKTTQYRFISCFNLAQGISVLQAIYGAFQTPCPVM